MWNVVALEPSLVSIVFQLLYSQWAVVVQEGKNAECSRVRTIIGVHRKKKIVKIGSKKK